MVADPSPEAPPAMPSAPVDPVNRGDPAPRASAVLSDGWDALRRNLGLLVVASVVVLVAEAPTFFTDVVFEAWFGAGIVASLYGLLADVAFDVLVTGPLGFGFAYLALRVLRDEDASFVDLGAGFRRYITAVLATLLTMVIVLLGFLLLIIPGFIFMARLILVPFLVTDKDMGAIEAVETSWERTRGHTFSILVFGLVAIGLLLVGLLALGVGLVVSIILIELGLAGFYLALQPKDEWEAVPAAPSETDTTSAA